MIAVHAKPLLEVFIYTYQLEAVIHGYQHIGNEELAYYKSHYHLQISEAIGLHHSRNRYKCDT